MTDVDEQRPSATISQSAALIAMLVATTGSIASAAVICLGGVFSIGSQDPGPWTLAYLAAFVVTVAALLVQSSLPDEVVRGAGLLFISSLLALPTLAAAWFPLLLLMSGFGSPSGVARGVAVLALSLTPVTCTIIASAQLTIFLEWDRRERLTAVGIVLGCSVLVVIVALFVCGTVG